MPRVRSEREKARARDRAKEWYQIPANREVARQRSEAWRKANPERQAELSRQWRARQTPEKMKAIWLKSKYQLSTEQYDQILAHHGTCDSCGIDKATDVDHEHATGQFRGLLCHACNTAAGYLRDDPKRARKLTDYLRRFI